jgi:HEAT repeat protein
MKLSLKICFLTLFAGLIFSVQKVPAQEFSPALWEAVPQVDEKLNSDDVRQRISVLLTIVVTRESLNIAPLKLPFALAESDYSLVVKKILEKDLSPVDDKLLLETLWKIRFVVNRFELRELAGPLAGYLTIFEKGSKSSDVKGGSQLEILEILKTLKATEYDAQIFSMLQSSSENVRREALQTLIEIGSKKAVPVLLEQLKDKDKRYSAIQNLVKLEAKEASPEIAKLLKVDDFNIKSAALHALVSLNAREQTLEIWNLIADERLKSLAVAALIYLADDKAIRWFAQQIGVDREFTLSVLGQAGNIKAKPLAPALISILEKGKVSDDLYSDTTIRRSIIACLGELQTKEAIPVLRKYVRTEISFRKWEAIRVLGDWETKDAVDDLIFVLNRALNGYTDKGYGSYGDEYHTISNAGLALAKIGDKKACQVLIAAAAHPKFDHGGEVVGGLNRHLDPALWEKAKSQKVSAGEYKSIKYAAELAGRETGIPIILELEPEKDFTLDATDGYPPVSTDENTTVFDVVSRTLTVIRNRTPAEKYTYIFDNGTIRILPLKKAVEWWRNNILTK